MDSCGTPRGIRTLTRQFLRLLPLPIGLQEHKWRKQEELHLYQPPYGGGILLLDDTCVNWGDRWESNPRNSPSQGGQITIPARTPCIGCGPGNRTQLPLLMRQGKPLSIARRNWSQLEDLHPLQHPYKGCTSLSRPNWPA